MKCILCALLNQVAEVGSFFNSVINNVLRLISRGLRNTEMDIVRFYKSYRLIEEC